MIGIQVGHNQLHKLAREIWKEAFSAGFQARDRDYTDEGLESVCEWNDSQSRKTVEALIERETTYINRDKK